MALNVSVYVFSLQPLLGCTDTPQVCWHGTINPQTCTTPTSLSHSLWFKDNVLHVCDSCTLSAACTPIAPPACTQHSPLSTVWWGISTSPNATDTFRPCANNAASYGLAFMEFGQQTAWYTAVCAFAVVCVLLFLVILRHGTTHNVHHAAPHVNRPHSITF